MPLEFTIGTPYVAPVANEYIASNARVSIITGPLGSSKTTASCQRILRHMVEQEPNRYRVRPTRFLVCRNTYPDLTTTTIPSFKAFFFPDEDPIDPETGEPLPRELLPPKLGTWRGGGEEPPHATFDFKLDDDTQVKSLVWFISLDTPADVRRLLGLEITAIWLSEAKELEKSLIDMMDLRHGRYPSMAQGRIMPTWHGMFGDTNRPNVDHWLFELSEVEKPEGWAFFHQPGGVLHAGTEPDGRKRWKVNPAAENLWNLPGGRDAKNKLRWLANPEDGGKPTLSGGSDYYKTSLGGKTDDWINVYLANEWGFVRSGKPVHPEFVDSIHTATEELRPVTGIPLVLGFDFGRTPACVVLQWWPGVGRWVALDELTSEDVSAQSFGPVCREWLIQRFGRDPLMRGWGDPAGDQKGQAVDETPMMILRSHGIPCQPAPTNKALLRRAALREVLMRGTMDGRRAFLLSPRCRVLREGLMGGWEFERVNIVGIERYKDEPAKNRWSHVCEALEYALVGEGESQAAIQPASGRRGHAPERDQEIAEL